MTSAAITDIIAALPEARKIGDAAYWSQIVPKILVAVMDEVVTSYDFDFTMREYSDLVTVANQSDYTVEGENGDCRDVVSVRLGSDKKPLARMRTLDVDVLSYLSALGGVTYWDPYTRTDYYPVIRLVPTPTASEAGQELWIRYRKKEIEITDFPSEFGYVLAQGVLAWIDPNRRRSFEARLRKMVRRYKAGGRDVQLMPIDPQRAVANEEIVDVYGAG